MHVAGRVSEARHVSSSYVCVRWSVASWQALRLTVPLGASRQSTLLGLLCVCVQGQYKIGRGLQITLWVFVLYYH